MPAGRIEPREVATRRATAADLEQVAGLFDGYRQFYRKPSALAAARAFLAERFARDDAVIFVATLRGDPRLVGFTQLYPVPSSVSLGRAWILNDLFVATDARGHGVGEALLERARRHGDETGALYLELATERTNTTAQRLYERLGWVRDRTFHHYELDLRSPQTSLK
jgi:ribosomal protein S18 acetylase RimI-like enzyme